MLVLKAPERAAGLSDDEVPVFSGCTYIGTLCGNVTASHDGRYSYYYNTEQDVTHVYRVDNMNVYNNIIFDTAPLPPSPEEFTSARMAEIEHKIGVIREMAKDDDMLKIKEAGLAKRQWLQYVDDWRKRNKT